ncbi:MAG TPA: TonB family protein [Bradyrhizobium sp.]|jgi:periplasmic protein TonB|nr:TonB family protein [Bradyrhizobium sp.]
MTAFALHLPERSGVPRWIAAGAVILAVHAALAAWVALGYVRQPPTPHLLPAISISLAPIEESSPDAQNQDIAVGPAMQQAEEQPKPEPKVEDKPIEQLVPPPPQQQAEVTLPTEQKEVEEPKQEVTPPAPETRAPPPTPKVAQFTQAASNAYDALILGHLQRFKRYPPAAHGAVGVVMVRFTLNRAGEVIKSEVTKSSGNSVLDHEAIDILHRANPFPPFPAAKSGSDDYYIAPIKFDRD